MRIVWRLAGTAVLAALFVVPAVAQAQAAVPGPRVTAAASGSPATEVLALVNAARSKAGCGPVRLDARLTAAAARHDRDMADHDYFDHVGPGGDTFVTRMKAAGYPQPRSENIAAGHADPAAAMQQWMTSPAHRTNILDCTATAMGVAVASNPASTYGIYWTQDFGTA